MSIKSGTIIGGSSSNHARHASDFYETPQEATVALINRHPWLLQGQVSEPACGNGAISKVLIEYGAQVSSSDLRHTGYGRGGVDFLVDEVSSVNNIVTNPPFDLALQFINRSLTTDATGVAMLLKATYWHAASRFDVFNRLDSKPSWVHPLTWRPAMAPDRGASPTMDFMWTVWDKRDERRDCHCGYEPLTRQ